MEPRVGETYHTTSAWNSYRQPRTITRIENDTPYYRINNRGHESKFSIEGFKRVTNSGAWYLPLPPALRLPDGV